MLVNPLRVSRPGEDPRGWIDLIEETAAVVSIKDASKPPWLILEGLDIHNLYKEKIAWLGTFNVKGT